MSTKWDELRKWTQARIGLGRAGHSLSTKALLDFQLAHARARDAVHRAWDAEKLAADLKKLGDSALIATSEAESRAEFLQYPDRGRQLSAADEVTLRKVKRGADLAVCVSDGLSSAAIDKHFLPLWKILRAELRSAKYKLAPLVLAPFGRVAISDAIGEALGAKAVVIFVGERPGLSSADSLGAYLTFAPKRGTPDSRRNCLSNIRPPEGLSYEGATRKLLFLVAESLRRQLSGIELKEETALASPASQKKRRTRRS